MRERKSGKGSGPPRCRKKNPTTVNHRVDRDTTQLFDLVFKLLIQDASSVALIPFINGLFGKSFSLDTKIRKVLTEHVRNRRHKLESIRSDCILEVGGEDFMIEAQIGNDRTIAVRILEYGIARARQTARSSTDGSQVVLTLPDPAVLYVEPTNATPDVIASRLTNPKGESLDYTAIPYKVTEETFKEVEARNLYLLLPFYLLVYRQDVKTPLAHGKSRETLAQAVKSLIRDAEGMLERGEARGVLMDTDAMMVLERIEQMYTELYGTYTEFQEEQMRLQERLKSKAKAQEAHWQAVVKQTENKILTLWKQGYSPEEVEKLLAQEAGRKTSSAMPVTPSNAHP